MRARAWLLAALAAARVASGAVVWRWRAAPRPIPSRGGAPLSLLLRAPLFKQWDPSWGGQPIGGSGEPMAEAGCAVACVAMAFTALGVAVDPGELNQDLKETKGFTARGWLIWQSCAELTGGRLRLVHAGNPSHARIDRALAAGTPAIVKVLLDGRVPHWVLIVGKEGLEYRVNDPLGPEREPVPLSILAAEIHALRLFEPAALPSPPGQTGLR